MFKSKIGGCTVVKVTDTVDSVVLVSALEGIHTIHRLFNIKSQESMRHQVIEEHGCFALAK